MGHDYVGPPLPEVAAIKEGFPSFRLEVPGFLGTLDPHQHVCVAASHVAKKWLNMDKVGLGKTVETIGLIAYQAAHGKKPRWIVVVEGSHLYQWKQEIERFTNIRPVIVNGSKARRQKILRQAKQSDSFLLLMTYGSVRVDFDDIRAIPNRSMAYDEAALLANENKTRQFAKWLNNGCEYAVAMSAEPVTRGDPTQLWTILDTLGVEVMDKGDFIDAFCVIEHKKFRVRGKYGPFVKNMDVVVGLKNERELVRLLAPYSIRRGDSVLPEGSWTINRQLRTCEMTSAHRAIYNNAVRGFKQKADQLTQIERLNTADLITQILVSPWVADEMSPRDAPKVDMLVNMLKYELVDYAAGKEVQRPCVVFCRHRRSTELVRDALAQEGISHIVYSGETESAKERHELVNQFVSGQARVFVMTGAGHRGVDGLQKVAHDLVLLDVVHSPSFVIQLIGRLARKGQLTKIVNAYFLMCEDTVEPRIMAKLHDRQSVADRMYSETRAQLFNESELSTLVELL